MKKALFKKMLFAILIAVAIAIWIMGSSFIFGEENAIILTLLFLFSTAMWVIESLLNNQQRR